MIARIRILKRDGMYVIQRRGLLFRWADFLEMSSLEDAYKHARILCLGKSQRYITLVGAKVEP